MRIAGINSPDYHHKQLQQRSSNSGSQDTSSSSPHSSSIQSSNLAVPVNSQHGAAAKQHQHPDSHNRRQASNNSTQYLPITDAQHGSAQHNGELMQTSAKATNKTGSGDRVQFYTQPGGVWNAYSTGGSSPGGHTGSAVPDNTAHKAKMAISEYMQTQFIEERLRFAEVMGIDDYA